MCLRRRSLNATLYRRRAGQRVTHLLPPPVCHFLFGDARLSYAHARAARSLGGGSDDFDSTDDSDHRNDDGGGVTTMERRYTFGASATTENFAFSDALAAAAATARQCRGSPRFLHLQWYCTAGLSPSFVSDAIALGRAGENRNNKKKKNKTDRSGEPEGNKKQKPKSKISVRPKDESSRVM